MYNQAQEREKGNQSALRDFRKLSTFCCHKLWMPFGRVCKQQLEIVTEQSTSNIFIMVGSVVKEKIIITINIIIRKWWVLLATGLSGPALRYQATVGAEESASQSMAAVDVLMMEIRRQRQIRRWMRDGEGGGAEINRRSFCNRRCRRRCRSLCGAHRLHLSSTLYQVCGTDMEETMMMRINSIKSHVTDSIFSL